MSNVTLSIGGRNFVVACAAGEEDHVSGLGRLIDEKIRGMGDMSGQSESRMLLFATLLLADELHESRSGASGSGDAPVASDVPFDLAERLDAIALRMENVAHLLEG